MGARKRNEGMRGKETNTRRIFSFPFFVFQTTKDQKEGKEKPKIKLQDHNDPPSVAPRTTNVAYIIVLKSNLKEAIAAPFLDVEAGAVLEVDEDKIKLVCAPPPVVVGSVWLPGIEADWLVDEVVVVVVVVIGLFEMGNEGEVA